METVVVTRHDALVEFLQEEGIITGEEKIMSHAEVEDIRGKRVIGVLPLSLAVEAAVVIEIPLNIPSELRGKELTVEQVREFSSSPNEYIVKHRAEEMEMLNELFDASVADGAAPACIAYTFMKHNPPPSYF